MAFMTCKYCHKEGVVVVTQATHTGDWVEEGLNGWRALNSDNSWHAIKGTEKYVCQNCGKSWKCKDEIEWEWYE